MTQSDEQVFRLALNLPPMERAALVEQLLRSFDSEPTITVKIEAAWAAESRDRMAAYERGEMTARPIDEVFMEIDRRSDV